MSLQAFQTAECDAVLAVLNRYGSTNVIILRTLLVCLSVGAIINFSISLLSCACPPRQVSRCSVFLLILSPVLVLVPYFVFDSRLEALNLGAIRLPDRPDPLPSLKGSLFNTVDHCKRVFAKSANSTNSTSSTSSTSSTNTANSTSTANPPSVPRKEREFPPPRGGEDRYYFGGQGDGWDIAVIACTLGSALIGMRTLFWILRGPRQSEADEALARSRAERAATLRENAERRLEMLSGDGVEPRSPEEVQRVLTRLRMSESAGRPLRGKQCAICLEEMRDGALSLLQCGHPYHEDCIGAWLRTAYRRECPMCKSAIEEGGARPSADPLAPADPLSAARRDSVAGTEAATAGTEPEISPAEEDGEGVVCADSRAVGGEGRTADSGRGVRDTDVVVGMDPTDGTEADCAPADARDRGFDAGDPTDRV